MQLETQMQNKSINIKKYMPKTGAIYGMLIFLIVFSLINPKFLSVSNFVNISRQFAVLAILTLCAFLAILTHQLDLSIGGVCSVTGMVLAVLLKNSAPLPLACLAAIGVGILFGVVNGLLAGFTTIPPFIITLATMNIASGLGLIIYQGTIQVTDSTLSWLSNGNLLFIPFPIILIALIYVVFYYILNKRRYGTRLYAVGGKVEAAKSAGINVIWTKMSVYLINGALSGVAGIMMVSRLSSANPSAAIGYELDAICATVLGGTSISGGKGKLGGALLGAIAIQMLRNGMNIIGLRIVSQKMIIGLVLIIILVIDVLRKESK